MLRVHDLTEREKKKALKRLYGKSTGLIAVVLLLFLIMLLCGTMVCLLVFWFGMENLEETILMYLFLAVYVGIVFYFLDLITGYFIHCRILKEQYENLPHWKKEKLLLLAHKYKRNQGICCDGQYVYGIMVELRRKRKKMVYMRTFRYVEISELIWVHRINEYVHMQSGIEPNSTNYVVQGAQILRMYIQDGRYLQGDCSKFEVSELFELLREKNPRCRLGYRKEWIPWITSVRKEKMN